MKKNRAVKVRIAISPKSNIPSIGLIRRTITKGIIKRTDEIPKPSPIHNDVQDLFLIDSASFEKYPVTALSIAFVIHSPIANVRCDLHGAYALGMKTYLSFKAMASEGAFYRVGSMLWLNSFFIEAQCLHYFTIA